MERHRPFSRCFLKLILPCILEDKKLRIPHKFVMKFGEQLSEVAEVVDPTGQVWKIGLTKSENNIWFDDRWPNFVEHYSISRGYVLVFKHKGCSNFNVNIFDMSACEITYPKKRGSASGEDNDFGENRLDHDEDETAAALGRLPKAPLPLGSKRKAVEAAKKFKPKNRSFMLPMRDYNFSRSILNVPLEISVYLEGHCDDIKLKVSDEREWPAKLTCQKRMVSKGWRAFHTENALRIGDVCVFEVIKSTEIVFKVTMFRR